jgi:hypothetical protein
MSSEFSQHFEEFLGRNGWPSKLSPWDVVERWEALVEMCSLCYRWGFYEFDNEVRVRGLLDLALNDPVLATYPQLEPMRVRIDAADARFRTVLSAKQIRSEGDPWWRRAILATAGDEYCEDVKRLYGIDLATLLTGPCHRSHWGNCGTP